MAISFFSGSAPEAYRLSRHYRSRGRLVVGGGPHVTYAEAEAGRYFDALVIGEAESVWESLLADAEALQIEEISVQENSRLAGNNLDQCGIGRELGIIIVAIKQSNGEMKFNPNFSTVIDSGDTLIAVGERSKLNVLEGLAK